MADEVTETKKERYKLVVSFGNEIQIFKRYAISPDEAKQILTDFLNPYYNGQFSIEEVEKDKTHRINEQK